MIQWSRLPLLQIRRRPGRSAALILLSAFLCFATLGGTLMISGLRSGLNSLEAKLGADIMVVPYEAATKAQLKDIILQGNPGYFYMNRSVMDKLKETEGVGQLSEQFFLASTSSGCCSLPVQIIGYDPETDFTILPWIRDSYDGTLAEGEILVGNDLNAFPGDTLTFYGSDCRVAAKLNRTGTYLDTSVFASEQTIKNLIVCAKEKKLFNFGDVDPEQIVSCALINVADGYSVEEVLGDINVHVRKVKAVRTQEMLEDVSRKLTGVSDLVGGLLIVVWLLSLVILALVFVMISGERRKEFAVLRAIGASRGQLARLLFKESVLLCLIGSGAGALLALLVLAGFGGAVESGMGLPFLLPGAGGTAGLAAAAVLISVAAGAVSAAVCGFRISRIDTALILRGEN